MSKRKDHMIKIKFKRGAQIQTYCGWMGYKDGKTKGYYQTVGKEKFKAVENILDCNCKDCKQNFKEIV